MPFLSLVILPTFKLDQERAILAEDEASSHLPGAFREPTGSAIEEVDPPSSNPVFDRTPVKGLG